MRSTHTSLATQASHSTDLHLLQPTTTDHTSFDQDDFNDSIDESFLASYHSMKHSSSSSPSQAMDTPADYQYNANGYSENDDFAMPGGVILDETLDDWHHNQYAGHDINSSATLPMDESIIQRPTSTEGAASPGLTTAQHIGASNGELAAPSTQPSGTSRRAHRPRTPLISISTDANQFPTAPSMIMNGHGGGYEDNYQAYNGLSAQGASPSVVVGMWDSPNVHNIHTPMDTATSPQEPAYFDSHLSAYEAMPLITNDMTSNTHGNPSNEEISARSGVDPFQRTYLNNKENKNLKDQAKEQETAATELLVDSWMTGGSVQPAPEDPSEWLDIELPSLPQRHRRPAVAAPKPKRPAATGSVTDPNTYSVQPPQDISHVRPVSPTASIRKNKVQNGQVYINLAATTCNAEDVTIADEVAVGMSRLMIDPPSFPDMVTTNHDQMSSNLAIERFNRQADNNSVFSRQATWGTMRRNSDPGIEAIGRGKLLKRLSIDKYEEKKPNPFVRAINMARKNSSSARSKLKRTRSDAGSGSRDHVASDESTMCAASLAPPRTPSTSRVRPTSPRIQTHLRDTLAPGDQRGHTRRASVGSVSPATSIGDFIKNKLPRSRSKSDLSQNGKGGIYQQWKGLGGPPVANPSPVEDSRGDEYSDISPDHDVSDADADGDEDEYHDSHYGQDPSPDWSVITEPTPDGFKAHIRQLCPRIPDYLLERLAFHQNTRYKLLLNNRKKHWDAARTNSCASGSLCGSSRPIEPKPKARNSRVNHAEEGSDANPEGKLGPENFPPGIPMPHADRFPAEFECHLCYSTKRFYKPSDWTKHVQEDLQPFTCTFPRCKAQQSFKRKADYVRHENEKHRRPESWVCDIDDCSHICHRSDNFVAHLNRVHRYVEPQAKSKAEVQKATGYDAEFWGIVNRCRRVAEFTAAGEPCAICEEVFSSLKKLTSHEAKHMEQISLPIIKAVQGVHIDGDTIISPVGAPPSDRQPTPAQALPHYSPWSQNQSYGSNDISPTGHGDFELFGGPSPSSLQAPAISSNPSRDGMRMHSQSLDYGMPANAIPIQRQRASVPGGTPYMSYQSRQTSASPYQQGLGYDMSPLANEFGGFGVGSQSDMFSGQGNSFGSQQGSFQPSHRSSPSDDLGRMNFPVTSQTFSGYSMPTTSMPVSASSGSYYVPISAPHDPMGFNAMPIYQDQPSNPIMIGAPINAYSSQWMDQQQTDFQNTVNMGGNHNNRTQHYSMQQNLLQQQAQHIQGQNLRPENQGQGHLARSSSAGNRRGQAGPTVWSDQRPMRQS